MSTNPGGYLWACMGGTELWNACLTSQLQANGHGVQDITCQDCSPCCDDLDKALGFGGPRGIGNAPWYDPTEPDSVHFAGLLVTSIEGLAPGEISRAVTQSAATTGAVLGQAVQSAPQVVVTGILMGDCCGADYGLSWLRQALQGSCKSTANCQGDDFTWLSCEPEFPDEDCPANAGQDYEALIKPYFRTFKNAALVAGPTVTQRIPRACPTCDGCPLIEVQFTIAAGDPCVYRDPVLLVETGVFTPVVDEDCVEWIDGTDPDADCSDCPTADNCATDPNCQDTSPPSMPSLLSSCFIACETDTHTRFCTDIPDGSFPVNGEGTLIVDIFSGSTAMRNIRLNVWNNPLGRPVSELDDCDVCSSLAISYVAPDSTLTIDGSNRSATISCPGGATVRANPFIASGSGSPAFTYPVFEGCGGPYTVCIEVDGEAAPNAFVSITTVGRQC